MQLHRIFISFTYTFIMLSVLVRANSNFTPESLSPDKQTLVNWQTARFSMFIYWGPVSLKGTEVGWSRGREVPVEEYDSFYQEFNPAYCNVNKCPTIRKLQLPRLPKLSL